MSDAAVTTWPRHCSGDIYAGVPTVRSTWVSRGSAPAPRRIAMPKSSTFTRPPSVIITLPGFMSRCTMSTPAPHRSHAWPQPRDAVRRGLHSRVVDRGRAGVLELRGDADLAQEPLAVALQRVEDLYRFRTVRRGGHMTGGPQHLDRDAPVQA